MLSLLAAAAAAVLTVSAPGVAAQGAAAPATAATGAAGEGTQAQREALAAHAIGINFAFMEVRHFTFFKTCWSSFSASPPQS